MYRGIFNIIMICLVLLAGCEESYRDGPVPMEGIKVGDLKPVAGETLGKKILFQVLTFEMPAKKRGELGRALDELRVMPLKFSDHPVFDSEGFSAGCGSKRMFDSTAARVYLAGATKIKTSTLMIFDSKDHDVSIKKITKEKIGVYVDADDDIMEQSFRSGKLAWRINAGKIASLKDTVEISVQPLFKRDITSTAMLLAGEKKYREKVFGSAGFKLRMGEGDFIFLWPGEQAENKNKLGNLFFSSHGDFLVRGDGGETSVKVLRDVPLIRFYLIICGGVQ